MVTPLSRDPLKSLCTNYKQYFGHFSERTLPDERLTWEKKVLDPHVLHFPYMLSNPLIPNFYTKTRSNYHYNTSRMQLKAILLGLAAVATSCADLTIVPINPVPVDCVPSDDANTCVLTYQTNSGVPNIQNPVKYWGKVKIYSPTCNFWGETDTTPKQNTTVWVMGLSFKKPMTITTEWLADELWDAPVFKYELWQQNSEYYYHHKDCWSCIAASNHGLTTHNCICDFACA